MLLVTGYREAAPVVVVDDEQEVVTDEAINEEEPSLAVLSISSRKLSGEPGCGLDGSEREFFSPPIVIICFASIW